MKLLNVIHKNEQRIGVQTDQGILNLTQASKIFDIKIPETMKDLIAENFIDNAQQLVSRAQDNQSLYFDNKEITFAPPISNPEKLLFVGLNYLKHVEESPGEGAPKFPVLFSKFNNALAAHTDTITLPQTGSQFDYEVELVIIIGKEAKDISKNEALSYVFGYSIGNDLSIRDLQYRSSQWLIGKSADQFAPVGPYIVTADEINPTNLNISMKRNGKIVQNSNTRHMIFDVATIISYASQMMTLKPGDLIFTGTPDGVIKGFPEDEQDWLKAGDHLEASIENIGTLNNQFI
jgi:2-keto-4-pentenoate hydratase/2-oxohepta-3-ene-1,7-dioic acid hydratase in catechol pathway